jgi:NAD(P)H-nitrite reductase large subunit
MSDWRNDDQLLCHCHGVKAGVVRRVVRELRPRDAREVGRACKAGTGCRSCVPDIETVMKQERAARKGWLARLLDRLRGGGRRSGR